MAFTFCHGIINIIIIYIIVFVKISKTEAWNTIFTKY